MKILKEGEQLDDLCYKGLTIIQAKKEYHFTSDAVILANLVQANAKVSVADLCSGSGIIAMLIAAKTNAKKVIGVEIQQKMVDRARRSAELNKLSDRVSFIVGDVNYCVQILGYGSQDIVVCNPPYYKVGEGEISENKEIALSRHEIALKLEDLIKVAGKLVKFGGKFYIVYRADRLSELVYLLTDAGLEPKKLISIQPAKGKAVDTVIVIAKRGAEKGMIVENWLRAELEYELYGKDSK